MISSPAINSENGKEGVKDEKNSQLNISKAQLIKTKETETKEENIGSKDYNQIHINEFVPSSVVDSEFQQKLSGKRVVNSAEGQQKESSAPEFHEIPKSRDAKNPGRWSKEEHKRFLEGNNNSFITV